MEKIYYFFHHGILFLSYLLACLAMTTTNITTDQSSLLALIDHVTFDPDEILAKNWSVKSSVCEWVGVTCGSRHHRVTALNISNMGLTGNIPPQLGNLSFLVSLDMSRNNFHGELPPELAKLHRLRTLNFGVNNLSGVVPSRFGWLQEIRYLSLRNNSFRGPIPPSIFNLSHLETLWLSGNLLEGKIPTEIGNLQKLKNLIIEDNKLSGSLPSVLFNISSLEAIALKNNRLSGSLPLNMCDHLQRLNSLNLSRNYLQGEIPSTLSHCSQLQVLWLNSNGFSGSIPKEIGNLRMLEELVLGHTNLNGIIPKEIGHLAMLKILSLADTYLSGPIPKVIGNLTMLKILDIGSAGLTGRIPDELGYLYRLEGLYLYNNSLSGVIPFGVFNLSTIRVMSLSDNRLTGNLASSFGEKLTNLEVLNLRNNELDGLIPAFISNASQLDILVLSRNKFSGPIPNAFGDLRLLRILGFYGNTLTNKLFSTELGFVTSLTNCKYLEALDFSENPALRGILPISVGNLSTSVINFYAFGCEINGNIPAGFGNLTNLLVLQLQYNLLTGSVPATFKSLQNLQGLFLQNNELNGPIPEILCDLKNLFNLILNQNQFSGSIPSCIGNVTSLGYLRISQNLLKYRVLPGLWNLNRLLELDLSSNSLSGSLPNEIQNLKAATNLNLSLNYISGNIPNSIGDLGNLITLSLAHNRLEGHIPDSLGQMLNLQFLDISDNNLSNVIPKSMEALSNLKYMNLSFNNLSGEIPSRGPFKNFTSQSFLSNGALCGSPRFSVPPCSPSPNPKSSRKKHFQVKYILLGFAAAVIAITLAIFFMRHQKKKKGQAAIVLSPLTITDRISYYELLQATDGYNERNLLGTGSTGSVYKGTLTNGTLVAVKVFNLHLEITHRSFISECEVLRNLRHRNLTKVVNVCSTDDFKALVLEYMPNGSLEKWLYSHNHYLDLKQRISIMVDVACALEYLHHGYTIPVVHCDLKPANILLDEDMVAHLGDFGLAKLLDEESGLHTKTLATLGYIAPEYGSEGLVSARSDVYSFGIVLMETFSRVKPSDEMFSEDLNLKSWIENSLHGATIQVIDANLLKAEDIHLSKKLEYISLILELALSCCKECPTDRMSMKDAVVALVKIKYQVLNVFGDQI